MTSIESPQGDVRSYEIHLLFINSLQIKNYYLLSGGASPRFFCVLLLDADIQRYRNRRFASRALTDNRFCFLVKKHESCLEHMAPFRLMHILT